MRAQWSLFTTLGAIMVEFDQIRERSLSDQWARKKDSDHSLLFPADGHIFPMLWSNFTNFVLSEKASTKEGEFDHILHQIIDRESPTLALAHIWFMIFMII